MIPGSDTAAPSVPKPLLASLRHTAMIVGVLLALAALGAFLQTRTTPGTAIMPQPSGRISLYVSLIAAQWGLFYWVVVGLRARGTSWRDLIGRSRENSRHLFRDVLIGLSAWVLWAAAAAGLKPVLGADAAKSISPLLPQSFAEILVWILLSVSAGFCEEFLFRGYLMQQFEVLTGGPQALLLQALLFGVSHGYQGWKACLVISVYGLLFGLLARWRRSLRPGMIAHAWTDVVGGLLPRS